MGVAENCGNQPHGTETGENESRATHQERDFPQCLPQSTRSPARMASAVDPSLAWGIIHEVKRTPMDANLKHSRQFRGLPVRSSHGNSRVTSRVTGQATRTRTSAGPSERTSRARPNLARIELHFLDLDRSDRGRIGKSLPQTRACRKSPKFCVEEDTATCSLLLLLGVHLGLQWVKNGPKQRLAWKLPGKYWETTHVILDTGPSPRSGRKWRFLDCRCCGSRRRFF